MAKTAALRTDPNTLHVSFQESFRLLRTNILYSENVNVIAVTSSAPNEGKTTIALNLAISFAAMGKRVLIVDSDLRKAGLRHHFKIDEKPVGLSEYLTSQSREIILHTDYENLDYIPSGKIPPNPGELLSSEKFKASFDSLRNEFDYIIFDTPPLEAAIDSAIIGRNCDGVIYVIRNDFMSRKQIIKHMNNLERNGCRIVGTVLNGVKKGQTEYKYNNYSYYYGND